MNVPELFAWWQQNAILTPSVTVAFLLFTAVVLGLSADWRISLPVLFLHHILLGGVTAGFASGRAAFVIWITGLFITVIFYFTGRRRPEMMPTADPADADWPTFAFRGVLTVVLAMAAWGLGHQPATQLVTADPILNTAVYGLLLLGVYRFVTDTRPLFLSIGVLMLFSAVALWQSARLPIGLAVGGWAVACLVTALLTTYLVQIDPKSSFS